MFLKYTKYVKPLLEAILSNQASFFEINQLVKIAHQFASIRLNQLIRNRKIHLDLLSHSITTTALDCIAELFQRDEEGKFTQFAHYFVDKNEIGKLTNDEVIQHFCSLVFTKLNDGVIHLLRESDPILSKILRNLKIAIQKNNQLYLFNRFGEFYFSPCSPDNREEHCSEFPSEEIISELLTSLHGKENISEYLNVISKIIRESN